MSCLMFSSAITYKILWEKHKMLINVVLPNPPKQCIQSPSLHCLAQVEDQSVLYDTPLSLLWGKVAIKEMTIINIFGPVLLNDRCMGYILGDHN